MPSLDKECSVDLTTFVALVCCAAIFLAWPFLDNLGQFEETRDQG